MSGVSRKMDAFPGSWLQYAAIEVGPKGKVVGVDIQQIQPVAPNVETILQDVTDLDAFEEQLLKIGVPHFDLVLSDIAPSTTGIPGVDQAKSVELSQMVVDVADKFLRSRGTLVMKVFEGEDFAAFFKSLKSKYGFVTAYKARASRERSIEKYIVCQRKK
jgi:23S rRNA (uridine2552-2'-O)-methyltransferase